MAGPRMKPPAPCCARTGTAARAAWPTRGRGEDSCRLPSSEPADLRRAPTGCHTSSSIAEQSS
eukprot:4536205-Alexandrium_andersonii.AAC.1